MVQGLMYHKQRKKILLIAYTILFAIGSFTLNMTPASADVNGDYPYYSMPCIHKPGVTQGNDYWCKNYDWGNDKGTTSPYGYGYRNCTDFVAWKLSTVGVAANMYRGLGHAKYWASNAEAKKLSVDETPKQYSVAVNEDGEFGHVAYVEKVHSDGKLDVAEYNKGQNGTFSLRYNISASEFKKFIDFGVKANTVIAPADADRDGIADQQDGCPTLPGPANTNGCPDSDGDAVRDSLDLAPLEPGTPANRGFPTSNRLVSGDFDGDGYDDSGVFYDYGGAHTRLWFFKGGPTGYQAPAIAWDSQAGNWSGKATKTAVADVNADNYDDVIAFYDYGGSTTRLWTFYGSATGPTAPVMTWFSGVGNWNWHSMQAIAGDFDGNGFGDVGAFYDYGGGHTRLWLFKSDGAALASPSEAWNSGPGQWTLANTKTTVSDINGDGKDDVVALFDYHENGVRAWVFEGSGTGSVTPVMHWYSGPGNWLWERIQLVGGDFDGDGHGDIASLYDYGGNTVRLLIHKGSAVGLEDPTVAWYSGVNNWAWQNNKLTTDDFNDDGYDDVTSFYYYGGNHTRAFTFYGSNLQTLAPIETWNSGPGNWNGDSM